MESLSRRGTLDVHSAFAQFIGILNLVRAAAGFLAGHGLLQRGAWARILALILGFLSLFNVPFGTALGVYTFWVLLPATSHQDTGHLRGLRREAMFIAGIGRSPLESSQGRRSSVGRAADS
jgi:hypothetical protein